MRASDGPAFSRAIRACAAASSYRCNAMRTVPTLTRLAASEGSTSTRRRKASSASALRPDLTSSTPICNQPSFMPGLSASTWRSRAIDSSVLAPGGQLGRAAPGLEHRRLVLGIGQRLAQRLGRHVRLAAHVPQRLQALEILGGDP